jgi:hypothetical protein
MLDFPASAEAFWRLYDLCGVRPEYVIPILWVESASNGTTRVFPPGIQNLGGGDYWGLIQANGPWLRARGIEPKEMSSWSASREIADVVTPWLCAQVHAFGKLRSGIRVYQSIFYPASLKATPDLMSPIVRAPPGGCTAAEVKTNAYCANPMFDADHKGFICPGDLGQTLRTRALVSPHVKDALAHTYELRPRETQQNPVYGTDFTQGGVPSSTASAELSDWASVFTILGGAATVAVVLASTKGS